LVEFHRMLGGCLVALLLPVAMSSADAEPMDLSNPTPRWVEVVIEGSPADRPAQLDAVWTAPRLSAFLRPAERPGWITVAIPAGLVEGQLLAAEEPIPGSFSPYIWIFDAATGHVVSAEMEGAVKRRMHLGLLAHSVRTDLVIRMDTERVVGVRAARKILGNRYFGTCSVEEGGCTPVYPAIYDRRTGYVNAVGAVEARAAGFSTRSFSSLGEARFFEHDPSSRVALRPTQPSVTPSYP
jgi:hypothetical protein